MAHHFNEGTKKQEALRRKLGHLSGGASSDIGY